MKTGLTLLAIYLAVVGAAEFMSNSATDSPTADMVAAFPSVGSIVAKSAGASTQGMLDLLGAGAAFYWARYRA